MLTISELLSDKRTLLIFDHLTVEVHIWELVRNNDGDIKTWTLVYANPPALDTWGRASLEEIKGMTTDEIFGEGATEHYMQVVAKVMNEGCCYSFQDYFPHIAKHFQFTTVPLGDYFITTGSDITELVENQKRIEEENKALELRVQQRTEELEHTVATLNHALEESKKLRDELKQLAIQDPLTNLYNRRYMEEALDQELKRCIRSNHPLSVIFCDIDRFKQINDRHGHETGDIALREVAAMAKKIVRDSDIVCRFGGDEIVIILPETTLKRAVQKAEELRSCVSRIDWQDHRQELADVTISSGVAEYPTNASTRQQLLKMADSALLVAKEKGRNLVEHA